MQSQSVEIRIAEILTENYSVLGNILSGEQEWCSVHRAMIAAELSFPQLYRTKTCAKYRQDDILVRHMGVSYSTLSWVRDSSCAKEHLRALRNVQMSQSGASLGQSFEVLIAQTAAS